MSYDTGDMDTIYTDGDALRYNGLMTLLRYYVIDIEESQPLPRHIGYVHAARV